MVIDIVRKGCEQIGKDKMELFLVMKNN